ncbi:MAG: winged helix-turn-helix domain-containing protein [Pyrinomonadaceae bacterium]
MNGAKTPIYRFNSFRLDVAERQLLQDGRPVPLTPKAFDVLALLVAKGGHLVEKEQLMQAVWPDSFVEETNVTRIVHTLRKTLGEDNNGSKFIETVPRRGYRFIAAVQCLDADEQRTARSNNKTAPHSPVVAGSSLSISPTVRQGSVVALADWMREPKTVDTELSIERRTELAAPGTRPITAHVPKLFIFVLTASIVGIIGLSYYFLPLRKTVAEKGETRSIAILPMKPINAASRDDIYEIGIADSLIRKVSSTGGLVVRPLSSIRKYVDVDQDAMAAGKEQEADYVLESTYQLADGKIRVNSQLINVRTGRIEETYVSENDATDVFAMQDAIAADVGNMLMVRFATTANASAATRGTTSEEGYRKYLQAMYLYDRRTLADAQKAVVLLDEALELDPNYARAWAGKAHVHRSLGNFGGSHSPREEYTRSGDAIKMALALDDSLADAHSALCENKFFYEWDFAGAERECKRAIELDSNSALAHEIYSRYLLVGNRFDESISEIKIAIDLEPASLFSQRTYGICLYYSRRNAEAVVQFKRIAEIDPNFTAVYHWLINALLSQGSEAEAFDWFMKSLALQKADEITLQSFRAAYQTSGWPGVGRERVKRFDEDKIRSYFLEASLMAHTGDKDKAFEYLETSFQRREWGIPYLTIDPSIDVLRDDRRYEDLVRRVAVSKVR